MVIENKTNQPLFKQTGTVPSLDGGLLDWFQPVTFITVQKSVVGYEVVETLTPVSFQGVVRFDTQTLDIKAEGQRKWRKLTVYANTAFAIDVDEIVEYLNVRYRVINFNDFSNYGYNYYSLIEDWEDNPSPISYPLVYTVLHYGLTMRGIPA